MGGRIILLGATGYTGALTAAALVERGSSPLLVGRNHELLDQLADSLGGLETAVVDVSGENPLDDLLVPRDALVTTVGPFVRLGEPALQSALSTGASYVDSTGEPAWIRRVFEANEQAEAAGTSLMTAFGYDYVPGNLAAAIALDRSGEAATRVDLGYFFTGRSRPSGGTAASLAGALLEPGFHWLDGQLLTERGGRSARRFATSSGEKAGISIGASEHFTIPRLAPEVRDVNVFLGWLGPRTAPVQAFSAGLAAATRIPGVKSGIGSVLGRLLPGSTGGPTEEQRGASGSLVVAETFDRSGELLQRVELIGPNGYDLTAAFLAEMAVGITEGIKMPHGAIGPVEALGLERLTTAAAAAGLVES